MGSIGGIEKMMVFGILVIIVAILGIAFYSAIKVEDDLTPHILKAKGEEDPIEIIDSGPINEAEPGEAQGNSDPVAEDVSASLVGFAGSRKSLKLDNRLEGQGGREESAEGGNSPDRSRAGELPGSGADEPAVLEKKFETYKVQPGDSFRRIARIRLGDEERYVEIQALNPDVDSTKLQIGQILQLPVGIPAKAEEPANAEKTSNPGTEEGNLYTVKPGDTLIKISRKFYDNATDWKKIYEANRDKISDPHVLKVGTVLRIPG